MRFYCSWLSFRTSTQNDRVDAFSFSLDDAIFSSSTSGSSAAFLRQSDTLLVLWIAEKFYFCSQYLRT